MEVLFLSDRIPELLLFVCIFLHLVLSRNEKSITKRKYCIQTYYQTDYLVLCCINSSIRYNYSINTVSSPIIHCFNYLPTSYRLFVIVGPTIWITCQIIKIGGNSWQFLHPINGIINLMVLLFLGIKTSSLSALCRDFSIVKNDRSITLH